MDKTLGSDLPNTAILQRIQPLPMSVAVQSQAWVYGRSLAGIVGSNPAGDMEVSFL
jgi:hypothetical protein